MQEQASFDNLVCAHTSMVYKFLEDFNATLAQVSLERCDA